MSIRKVLTVVGTRPNFIKITQFHKAFEEYGIEHVMVHTGQHFDKNMSQVFFEQLQIPKPQFQFTPSTNSVIEQQADITTGLQNVINEVNPDLVCVVGDVNSTFSAAFTAYKLGKKIAHIESGLRSRDRSMPEEINRILTDEITDYYFVTEQSGLDNLKDERRDHGDNVFFVGNTMIDTLYAFREEIDASKVAEELGVEKGKYCLVTMHRPATVDVKEELLKMISIFDSVTKKLKIVFPIHPRTRKNLEKFGLIERVEGNPNITLAPPMGYLEFQHLIKNSAFCLTDSGGIQEETTYLTVPCITLRPNTERPSTLTLGTNTLLNLDVEKVLSTIDSILDGSYKKGEVPPLWDGKASWRIAEAISNIQ